MKIRDRLCNIDEQIENYDSTTPKSNSYVTRYITKKDEDAIAEALINHYHFPGMFDDQNSSEIIQNFESFYSRPMPSINIPEPVSDNENSGFVYNYFVPDEKINDQGYTQDTIVNTLNWDMHEALFLQGAKKIPRFNKISFQLPDEVGANVIVRNQGIRLLIGQIKISHGLTDLEAADRMLKSIYVEGASSNAYFTGVEMIDTLADKKIYQIFSSSFILNEIDSDRLSNTEMYDKFLESIKDNGSPI